MVSISATTDNDPLNRVDPTGLRPGDGDLIPDEVAYAQCVAAMRAGVGGWPEYYYFFGSVTASDGQELTGCVGFDGCSTDNVWGPLEGASRWSCENGDVIAQIAGFVVTLLPGYDCVATVVDFSWGSAGFCALDFIPGVGKADEGAAVIVKVGDHVGDAGSAVARKADELAASACRASSFDQETPILMANGETRPISQIREGDEVLATNTETGETQARTVTDTIVMLHDGDLLDLTIEGDDGAGIVYTTDEHKFWSITDNAWVPAIELDQGDQLRQADGTTATVTDVDERDGRQDMWDLTVAVDHTFYVATGEPVDDPSALVHNQGKWCSPSEWANSKWREIRNKYRDDPNFPSGQHDAGLRAAIREARELIRTGGLLPEVVEELERIIDYWERAARGIGHR